MLKFFEQVGKAIIRIIQKTVETLAKMVRPKMRSEIDDH